MDNTPVEPAATLARNNPGLYQSTTSMGDRHAGWTAERMAIFFGMLAETVASGSLTSFSMELTCAHT